LTSYAHPISSASFRFENSNRGRDADPRISDARDLLSSLLYRLCDPRCRTPRDQRFLGPARILELVGFIMSALVGVPLRHGVVERMVAVRDRLRGPAHGRGAQEHAALAWNDHHRAQGGASNEADFSRACSRHKHCTSQTSKPFFRRSRRGGQEGTRGCRAMDRERRHGVPRRPHPPGPSR